MKIEKRRLRRDPLRKEKATNVVRSPLSGPSDGEEALPHARCGKIEAIQESHINWTGSLVAVYLCEESISERERFVQSLPSSTDVTTSSQNRHGSSAERMRNTSAENRCPKGANAFEGGGWRSGEKQRKNLCETNMLAVLHLATWERHL